MEIKNTNESFVIESVPAPNDQSLIMDQSPEVVNATENEKYDVVNDKLQSSTESPKVDCMDSPLKQLIIKCDGNIRLRQYTEEERTKAEEQRNTFRKQLEERMQEMRRQMQEAHRIFERNLKGKFYILNFK